MPQQKGVVQRYEDFCALVISKKPLKDVYKIHHYGYWVFINPWIKYYMILNIAKNYTDVFHVTEDCNMRIFFSQLLLFQEFLKRSSTVCGLVRFKLGVI